MTTSQVISCSNTLLGEHAVSANLLISGQFIAEIHPCDASLRLQEAQELARTHTCSVVDLGQNLLTPAFVNCHTHLAMNFFRGLSVEKFTAGNMIEDLFFHVESRLTPADVRAFTRMGAYESLLSGVGLVWDHYYHGSAVAEALSETGLCGVVAPTLQDLSGPGVPLTEKMFAETLEISKNTEYRSKGIFAALGPHAPDTVSEDLWKKIIDASKLHKLPVHSHAAQTFEEFERIHTRHNCSPFAFLERMGVFAESESAVLVHCIYTSQADLNLLDKNKNYMVFCPFSQLIFQYPANILNWEAAGISWAVATDCAASNDSMGVQKEMRFVAGFPRLSLAFSEGTREFQRTGSTQAAKSIAAERESAEKLSRTFEDASFLLDKTLGTPGKMHPQFKAGIIAKGALANLISWESSHPSLWPLLRPTRALAMNDSAGAISNVMLAGKWLGTSGSFQESILGSAEFKEAHTEAQARYDELMERLRT